MLNGKDIQSAFILYLKSLASVTSLLGIAGADEIREAEWQGQEFTYPNVRVSIDFRPSLEGCGPDNVDFTLDVFSELPSSMESQTISGALSTALHKRPFESSGIRFSTVVIRSVNKPIRSIFGWQSQIQGYMQAN